MDDKNFKEDTAAEWIRTIESANSRIRDQDIYPLLRDWIAKSMPSNVLDIGCGQGVCSTALEMKSCRYVGVDPSATLVKRANELYLNPDREFILGNIYALPFRPQSFDAAFSVAVWHLLEKINEATHEVGRILKSGGSFLLIMADPSSYSAWTDCYQEKKFSGVRFEGTNKMPDGLSSKDILYLHSQEDIFAAIELAGIKILKVNTFRNQIAIEGLKI